METTLHRQLKALYCGEESQQEIRVGGYRIDAVNEGTLVEIQQGSLAAIRDKIRDLLQNHQVLVVKPLVARKFLIRRKRRGGAIQSSRYSPLHENELHLFSDLVHFVGVFPHPWLTFEVVLTEQEEERLPATRHRRGRKDYRVHDRSLLSIRSRVVLRTADDLLSLLPAGVPDPFTTEEIAREAGIPRWLAQKMAYCLRKTAAVATVGKRGNAHLYRATPAANRRAA